MTKFLGPVEWQRVARLLVDLGKRVRDHVVDGREPERDSTPVSFVGGDLVYAIDKRVEPVIVSSLREWPADFLPLTLVAEGLAEHGGLRIGSQSGDAKLRLIIDPIDGTRGLMYDKRSAWFLAAAAQDKGAETKLSDVCASVLVELPTSKQAWVDIYAASIGSPLSASRSLLGGSIERPVIPRPSTEESLLGGFGQVSDFFPGTHGLPSSLMDHILARILGPALPGHAPVFYDQYISTGGQLVELMSGRDRFCCDLRPLFFDILERQHPGSVNRGLECHPYDMAGLLAARTAGVVITDGFGGPLDGPLDTSTGLHWIGYANARLRTAIEPAIQSWLSTRLSIT